MLHKINKLLEYKNTTKKVKTRIDNPLDGCYYNTCRSDKADDKKHQFI